MKLSYRDKVIFIVAIVIIIAVAGVFLFIKPKFEEMNQAKNVLETKQSEKAELEKKINTFPDLVESLKATAQEVEEVQSYFLPDLEPYQNEQFVYEMLKECGLDISAINTKYTSGTTIGEYMVEVKNQHSYDLLIQGDLYNELPQEIYDHYNRIGVGRGASIVVGVTEVRVDYTDDSRTNEKLFKFINMIADDERTMHIPTFSGTADDVRRAEDSDDKLSGSIELRLYSLFPLNIEKVMEESNQVEQSFAQ